MTESDLITKCKALAPAGDALARAVLRLAADRDRLREALARVCELATAPDHTLSNEWYSRLNSVKLTATAELAKVPG